MLYKGEIYSKQRFIIDIVLSVISFILFILSGATIYTPGMKDRLLNDILTNWNSSLIYDITAKSSSSCPTDYEELILNHFEGTKEGCNCLGRSGNQIKDKQTDTISPYPCSYDLLDSNCYKVLPVSPKTMKLWQTKVLCVKKTNETFYDHIRSSVFNSDQCTSGTKPCGQIDTLMNRLCIETSKPCPINKLAASSFREPNDFTYTEIPMTQRHSLYFTTLGDNATIPIQFAISEGNMCIDPNELNSQFVPYTLIKESKDYYCSNLNKTIKYDPRYIKLDSMTTKDLFDQNGILTPLLNLPHYPKEQFDAVTSLFIRSYIGWNLTCLDNDRTAPEYLRNVTETIDEVRKVNISIFVIVGIAFIYLLLISIFFKRLNPLELIFLNVSYGISIGLYLVIFALSLYAFITILKIDFGIFICGDDITNTVFNSLYTKLLYTKTVYLIIGVCFLGFLVTYLTVFLMAMVNEKKHPNPNRVKGLNPSDGAIMKESPIDINKNSMLKYPNTSYLGGNKGGFDEDQTLKGNQDDSRRYKPKVPDLPPQRHGIVIGSKFKKEDDDSVSEGKDDKWGDKRGPKADPNIVEYK